MSDSANKENESQDIRPFLLVEDNPINQKVALRILAQYGFQADAVYNGEEALQALKSKAYDVILMDIQMPVLDGISATRLIRETYGSSAHYIIAVTANVTEEDRRNCREAGMDDFVTKPIRPAVLMDAIAKAPSKAFLNRSSKTTA